MDCGNGLTFIARGCPGYREAVDAATLHSNQVYG